MNITDFTFIVATKDNDKKMKNFYIKYLGFKPNEMGGVTLGNLNIFFDRHSKAALKSKEPFRHMLTLSVDGLQKSVKELKSKKIKFVKESAREEWGGWFATFEDPDGNYIQLFEMPKESK